MPDDEKALIEIKKLNTLISRYYKDTSDHWKNVHDPLKKRISELENELKRVEIIANAKAVVVPEGKGIFWTNKIASLREEIKNGDIMVLEPLMKDITELKQRIEKLKEQLTTHGHNTYYNGIILNTEVLQDHYKQRIEKSDWTIKALESPDKEKQKTMVEYIKDDLEFYKKQLQKLSGEKDVSGVKNTGGAAPTRNAECLSPIQLSDDSKPESKYCKHGTPPDVHCMDCLDEAIKEQAEKPSDVDYIRKKSIFISDYYYDCNIVDCPIKEAILSYEGNYYCLKHFIELIQDDRVKKEPSDSKNIIFPTKLTYEDEHPEDSEYKTPESVKFIKEFDFKKEEPKYILSADGYCLNPKKLIAEFLNDWKWGNALKNHKWNYLTLIKCKCPHHIIFWKWFEKKWQQKLQEDMNHGE